MVTTYSNRIISSAIAHYFTIPTPVDLSWFRYCSTCATSTDVYTSIPELLPEMVGSRALNAFSDGSSARSKKDANPYRPKPAAFRFQDASNKALEDQRRNQLKCKLIDTVKADQLEKYRKSEDEVQLPLLLSLTVLLSLIVEGY